MKITDFIYHQMSIFSKMDNIRSIPALLDGFKDVQRKIVFGIETVPDAEIRVSQLAGHSALRTHYGHGEKAMADAIVLMAQKYPGSNNLNLFEPCGQFGTILSPTGGSVRYIYTKKSKLFDYVILDEDSGLLTHRPEELTNCEPYFYLPIVPMWAVNGADGIGTGHSTDILPRDPVHVCDTILAMLSSTPIDPVWLSPSFKGRVVDITPTDTGWAITGKIEKVNANRLRITGIPVGVTLTKYKQILVGLMESGVINTYENESTEDGFNIIVQAPRELCAKPVDELITIFKLVKRVSENVTLHDPIAGLIRFSNYESALGRWLELRLPFYQHRKDQIVEDLKYSIHEIESENEFIALCFERTEKGLHDAVALELESEHRFGDTFTESFMRLNVGQISDQRVEKNKRKLAELKAKLTLMSATSPQDLFVADLNRLKVACASSS